MFRNMKSSTVVVSMWVFASVLSSLCPVLARADSTTPAELQPISGGGQIALSNANYALPLVARVVAADGTPLAGVPVHFIAPHCRHDGTICGIYEDYAFFPSHQVDVTVTSDANGLAVAPPIRASAIPEGEHTFLATVNVGSPPNQVVLETRFTIYQFASPQGVPITAGFTGSWYNPGQSGHGLSMEVLSGNRVLVAWHAFTPDGTQQAWISGVGQIEGNHIIVMMYRPLGGKWGYEFDSSTIVRSYWGTLTLTFDDCVHGRVLAAPNGNNGNGRWLGEWLELTRLTIPAGLSCP